MIVEFKAPPRAPPDLADKLRGWADQVEAGEITGLVLAYLCNDNYEFIYADSLINCLIMADMLHDNCLDRMRA